MEHTSQHLSSYNGQTVLLKQLPNSLISKETLYKGELRLTSGGYPSEVKIAEKETGSNPYYSAATAGDPQASRAWSGPQQSYSSGA